MQVFEAMRRLREQNQNEKRRKFLDAVRLVSNQMLAKYEREIEAGEIKVADIVKIGNDYIKTFTQ